MQITTKIIAPQIRRYLLADGADANVNQREELRFHRTGRDESGADLYIETATIRTRTLASVGGIRPGCNHTKRSNRKARKAGYPDYKTWLDAMVKLAKGDMSMLRRLMAGGA